VEHAGRLLTKDELMQSVWPDSVVEENNLNHNVSVLRRALGESYGQTPVAYEAALNIDFEVIKPKLLSVENVEKLAQIEPCGSGNPQAVLCIRGATVENVVPLSEGKHTKMWITKGGEMFEAVFFRRSAGDMGAEAGMKADVAFTPQVNEFRGRRGVQLNLMDFRQAE
jgi:single-stranded-DNA-specific exonuclease